MSHRFWLSLLICLFVGLAACGSEPLPDNGTQPGPSVGAASSLPSVSAAASMAASEAVSPAASAAVPETSAASSAAVTEDQPVITFTRSGGIQGKTQTLVVGSDGSLQLLNGDATGNVFATAQADASQIEALKAALASSEWQQLDATYGRQVPDGFAYMISDGGKRVTTYDSAQNPPVLEDILSQVNSLWQAAQSAPTS